MVLPKREMNAEIRTLRQVCANAGDDGADALPCEGSLRGLAGLRTELPEAGIDLAFMGHQVAHHHFAGQKAGRMRRIGASRGPHTLACGLAASPMMSARPANAASGMPPPIHFAKGSQVRMYSEQ